jgi:hypothetical protein
MKLISLALLLLLTGCVNPENSNDHKYWVKVFLTDKWTIYRYLTPKELDSFLEEVNCTKNRFIEFGDFFVNKDQIKAMHVS